MGTEITRREFLAAGGGALSGVVLWSLAPSPASSDGALAWTPLDAAEIESAVQLREFIREALGPDHWPVVFRVEGGSMFYRFVPPPRVVPPREPAEPPYGLSDLNKNNESGHGAD